MRREVKDLGDHMAAVLLRFRKRVYFVDRQRATNVARVGLVRSRQCHLLPIAAAIGFLSGSLAAALMTRYLAARVLASFCEEKALELQAIMNNSHAGCPFCSTFVSVSTSVFKLMGLSNMHRHMNVLDSPADPHLL